MEPAILSLAYELDPSAPPENVDTVEEMEFAVEMRLARAEVVKQMPVLHKKEELPPSRTFRGVVADITEGTAASGEFFHVVQVFRRADGSSSDYICPVAGSETLGKKRRVVPARRQSRARQSTLRGRVGGLT